MNPITARPLFRVVVLLTLCLMPSVAAAQIPDFLYFYAFGDSLADNGNILIQTTALRLDPPVPPSATPHMAYDDGRFSNGRVAFEYLWQEISGHPPGSRHALKPFLAAPFSLNARAVNFAFGGTGTAYVDQTPGCFWAPGLKGQVELFRLALRGRKPARALYAIVTGANDYSADACNVPMSPEGVVRNIEAAIASLYQLGARDVIVLDLPDLGMIPANAGNPAASLISDAHNLEFDKAMVRLKARYPRLTLIPVKLNPLFTALRLSMEWQIPLMATLPGAPPWIAACLFAPFGPASCIDMDSLFDSDMPFLFWDVVHPTTKAHSVLADYIYAHLEAEYE